MAGRELEKSTRNEKILLDIVEEYIESAQPVSSGSFLRKHKYNISSATLRNIMAELDEAGFLYQPHTSAGRVPTEKGYRFYVDKVALGAREPIKKDKKQDRKEEFEKRVRKEVHSAMQSSPDAAARLLSQRLAEMTNTLAFAGLVHINQFYKEGLRYLLDEPEFLTAESVRNLVEYTESLESRLEQLYNSIQDDIRVYIGDNEAEQVSPFSLMAFRSKLPNKEEAIFGILGPMRMPYDEHFRMLESIRELFDEEA